MRASPWWRAPVAYRTASAGRTKGAPPPPEPGAARVDLAALAAARREGARHDHGVGKGEQRRGQCHRQQRLEVAERQQRQRQAGQPARNRADACHASLVEIPQRDRESRRDQSDERARNPGRQAPAQQDDRNARRPNGERRQMGLIQPTGDADELLDGRLAHGLEAQQLGQLCRRDHKRQPMHEAHDHRLGKKVGDEAQLQPAGQQAEHADHHAEPRRQQRQPAGIARRHRQHHDGEPQPDAAHHRQAVAGGQVQVQGVPDFLELN